MRVLNHSFKKFYGQKNSTIFKQLPLIRIHYVFTVQYKSFDVILKMPLCFATVALAVQRRPFPKEMFAN